MSLNVEDLRLKAQSLRDRAKAAFDDQERVACLDLARDYEAYLASLSPRSAEDLAADPAHLASADGYRPSAAETRESGAVPDLGYSQRGLQQKGRD